MASFAPYFPLSLVRRTGNKPVLSALSASDLALAASAAEVLVGLSAWLLDGKSVALAS